MENKNFKKLIQLVQERGDFTQVLGRVNELYLVKIYKITELTSANIVELYQILQKKFYLHRKTSNEEFWYENELRIFIWLLFAYLHLFAKNITDLHDDDWKFFTPIFNYKSTVFFEFQALSLLKPQGRPPLWSEEETQLLQSIIHEKDHKNRWNSIARELFFKSNRRYFRNPKQCRERWMNHLDPSKIRTEWTAAEDLVLLNCIKRKGKKWSVAVKELEHTRTEHMVKNRYKSLISNEGKKYQGKKEFEIENILIKKLTKGQQRLARGAEQVKEEERERAPIRKAAKKAVECKMEEGVGSSSKAESCPGVVVQSIRESGRVIAQPESQFEMNFNSQDELQEHLHIHSPFFIAWKIDEMGSKFSLMDDEKGHFREDVYCDVESDNEQGSFLRI